jgi:fumarate reductase subunit D
MKNSKLVLRILLGLILLAGAVVSYIIDPILSICLGILILLGVLMVSILEVEANYVVFGKKYNIFYQIGKFLDSLPQIIKDKK